MQGKAFHRFLDLVHEVAANISLSLSGVVCGGRRCSLLGLKPRAHLYGQAYHEQRGKQACQETKILRYSEVTEKQLVEERSHLRPAFLNYFCSYLLNTHSRGILNEVLVNSQPCYPVGSSRP